MNIKSFTHWSVVMVAIVVVSYTTLYFSKAEAVYTRSVGTISVAQFAPNAGVGIEFVNLSFSGILGGDSVTNLSGWSLRSDTGFNYDLSEVILTNDGLVKICGDSKEDGSCDYVWEGTNMFGDESGSLQIIARDGTAVIYIPYGDDSSMIDGSTVLSGSGPYIDDVYTVGDKISICSMQKNGNLRLQNSNIKKITRDVDSDVLNQIDIIPPFVYENNKRLNYHPGINWPEGKGILERGCQ